MHSTKVQIQCSGDWCAGRIVNVTQNDFTVRLAPAQGRRFNLASQDGVSSWSFGLRSLTSQESTDYVIPLAGRELSMTDLLKLAKRNLCCIDWHSMSLEVLSGSSQCGRVTGDSSLSRPLRAGEKIDFFVSHSWHDPALQKWQRLQELAEVFHNEKGRYPTLWLDKVCIDQSNIADGLRVLPITVAASKKVVALVGETYPQRLWCAWELFTVFAFAEEKVACSRVQLSPLASTSNDSSLAALRAFEVAQAHCYDPNEEARLRGIIDTVGARAFEARIQHLSRVCTEA